MQLTDEEVSQIEQPIVAAKEAQRRQRQEEERIKQKQQFKSITTKKTISRRKFLERAVLGGGGLVALAVREFFNPSTEITPSNTKITPDTTITPSPSPKPISLEKFKFEVVTDNGITLDMVSIPGCSFKMGSPPGEKGRTNDESPQHTVNVPDFFMSRFEVTQEQYQQVMGKNPSYFNGDKHPVEKVPWNDAVEFCKKLSQKTGRTYRLPSEAEWEYACRAGTTTPFHFGNNITGDLANYDASMIFANEFKGELREETTPVGQFPPNSFGLYDMHGNVWEWCLDDWHSDYEDARTDGRSYLDNENDNLYQKQGNAILRGGSWNNTPGSCRSASRYFNGWRVGINGSLGFRVACVSGEF